MATKPRRLLWCDAEANCHRLSSRPQVAKIVRKAKQAGIDTLIVDIKPLGGEVLYRSRYALRLGEVDGRPYPEAFDLLATMLEVGHAEGLSIHAAVNVFSEGHRQWERGPAYQHPEWQATMYEVIRTVGLGDQRITVEVTDPWKPVSEPAVYTRKSGKAVCPQVVGCCIAIEEGRVVDVSAESSQEMVIPENGCVLSLPHSVARPGISPGVPVTWHAEPVFRRAAESRVPSFGIFVNPIGPAREHELRIIEEILSGYNVDGIVFDRMRYPNLYADFSALSRDAFEAWLSRGDVRWPEDIFTFNDLPWLPRVPGRYYREWLEWRALQIRNFAAEASELARSKRPGVDVAVYVGSWYDSYYDVGVNWGSRTYHADLDWMTKTYAGSGYAEMFDYICTGCYYPVATCEEARECGKAEGATVEAACRLSCTAVNGDCPVYGSLYLLDYRDRPDAFRRAVEVAQHHSDGVMLFDLVYLEEYGWWPILTETLQREPSSPHDA